MKLLCNNIALLHQGYAVGFIDQGLGLVHDLLLQLSIGGGEVGIHQVEGFCQLSKLIIAQIFCLSGEVSLAYMFRYL